MNRLQIQTILVLSCFALCGCLDEQPAPELLFSVMTCDSDTIYVETFKTEEYNGNFTSLPDLQELYTYNGDNFLIGFLSTDVKSIDDYFNRPGGGYKKGSVYNILLDYKKNDLSVDYSLAGQLEEYIISTYEDFPYNEIFQYRKEELSDLVIKADKQLFGMLPGESLNEYFNMFGTIGNYRYNDPYFFTYDKELIPISVEGKSIEEFLSYRPLIPPLTYVKLAETPPEAPLDVKFTVTVTVKNKAPMSDTTRTITLL